MGHVTKGRTRSVIDTWLTQTLASHRTTRSRVGHHYTYPSSLEVVVLLCSTSVTVTSPSLDSLRLEVFLTFLVFRSVVVYWTCTSTSAMAEVGAAQFAKEAISPNAVATRIRMASTGGWIAGIIPECLAAYAGGGSLGFKFGWVTERAGARAAFPSVRRIERFPR